MPADVAEILFDLSLDHGFDYRVPVSLWGQVHPGSRVRVPLGRSVRSGYVVELRDTTEVRGPLREILSLESPQEQIAPALLKLGEWICSYYCCPRAHALRMLLPAVVRSGEMKPKVACHLSLTSKAMANMGDPSLTERQSELLRDLLQNGPAFQSEFLARTHASLPTLERLESAGWILREMRSVDRDPFQNQLVQPDLPKNLTAGQAAVLAPVVQALRKQQSEVFLLHGVTGSGKTEVYLQAIAQCLEQGREAIVLVPEIALTPQTCERFRRRFGNLVSVLHSALSNGERYDEWMRIQDGRSKIAVGARSALFAPFRKLGLIVVDEEHENTYKQEESPRYHARDVAVVRGKMEQAVVLLGSATPSLESYYNARKGKYRLLEMPDRIDGSFLPRVELVDMQQERSAAGESQLFSRRLKEMIQDRIHKGEQVILFLNRRGYATQMICPGCGYVSRCSNCDLAHTFHRRENQLICHMCGEQLPAPSRCPQCGSEEIRYSGIGTEKIEAIARALFPNARVARMDADTMTKKDSYRKTLQDFRTGKTNLLIGTQMIAKGLDFPNVTLVGVMQADSTLNLPDFRSGERTFQLITQVAGRAGRGNTPGVVVVQTYTPRHFVLTAASEQNFQNFYENEFPARQTLDFPPVSHMALVHFQAKEEAAAQEAAEKFVREIQPLLPPGVQEIGPMPSPLSRCKTMYRYQYQLRGGDICRLTRLLRAMVVGRPAPKNVQIFVDVDPRSLM